MTASRYSRDAEYFSAVRGKRNIVEDLYAVLVGARKTANDYARLRIHGLRTLYIEADLFADHHLRKRKLGRIRGRNIADILTAAEYRNAVGHRQHLMELMRYYDDRLSIVSHIFDYVKQLFGFLRGKHGGRLIEYEYIGTAVQHLDNLQRLFL